MKTVRAKYSIGLDYGTNSVRCLIVDTRNGREVGTAVWEYAHGTHGVILARDPQRIPVATDAAHDAIAQGAPFAALEIED